MNLFQIFLILLFQIFFISLLVKKILVRTLSLFDFFFILLIDIIASIFVIKPELIQRISNIFGIGRGVDLFIYISILTIFFILFLFYLKIERIREDITKVVRYLSIKEFQKNDLKKKNIKDE